MLDNAATASAVLSFLTPLTVGVTLLVRRCTGAVGQLRVPLVNSLKLLLLPAGTAPAAAAVRHPAHGPPGDPAAAVPTTAARAHRPAAHPVHAGPAHPVRPRPAARPRRPHGG
ncbi:hypothetical protein ABT301_13270 [Streptomyces sp. NPDC000987]|uniref:hypothetical protein n=1 Tax=Streptomyces sp. NPDC000987 TaxID=3154374 RepID=UPI00332E35DC